MQSKELRNYYLDYCNKRMSGATRDQLFLALFDIIEKLEDEIADIRYRYVMRDDLDD